MFCPDGYTSWTDFSDATRLWARQGILARALASDGKDWSKAFSEDSMTFLDIIFDGKTSYSVSTSAEKRRFAESVLTTCIQRVLLYEVEPLICSPEGQVLRPAEILTMHADGLEYLQWDWPLSKVIEFRGLFRWFDEGRYTADTLASRFCFIDSATGVLTLKPDSAELLEQAVLERWTHSKCEQACAQLAAPFEGWAVTWKDQKVLSMGWDALSLMGVVEQDWVRPSNIAAPPKRPIPRKRDLAREAYAHLYPDGHQAKGDTWKSAANEVSKMINMIVSTDTLQRAVGRK